MLPEPGANASLADEDVRIMVSERLVEALELRGQGYRVDEGMLADALAYAASSGMSLHGACEEVDGLADDTTLRAYLSTSINGQELASLEERLSASLLKDLPPAVFRGRHHIALDLHDQPFYGTDETLRRYACRMEAKNGTTWCFRVATAYLMLGRLRLTLAVIFVMPQDELADIASVLLQRVRDARIGIGLCWLDRGFASVAMILALRREQVRGVIACPIRGKHGGTRALCRGRQSYLTHHTFHSQEHGDLEAKVAVVRALNKKRQFVWHLYILVDCQLTPAEVHRHYRRRFGIESSYRQMRQVRIRTTSQNPAWRFVAMAIGFLLVNVWTLLRFLFCQLPRRAGRTLDAGRFRLRRLASFIRNAIERRYGVVSYITAFVPPLTS